MIHIDIHFPCMTITRSECGQPLSMPVTKGYFLLAKLVRNSGQAFEVRQLEYMWRRLIKIPSVHPLISISLPNQMGNARTLKVKWQRELSDAVHLMPEYYAQEICSQLRIVDDCFSLSAIDGIVASIQYHPSAFSTSNQGCFKKPMQILQSPNFSMFV